MLVKTGKPPKYSSLDEDAPLIAIILVCRSHPIYDNMDSGELRWYGYVYISAALFILFFRRHVFGFLIRTLSKTYARRRCVIFGRLIAQSEATEFSAEDYWTKAAARFRVVRMSDMSSSELLADDPDNIAAAEARYNLSWPCEMGACDIFVSQCAEDEAALRWQALDKIVQSFRNENGREPTLFLHQFCVDPQSSDEDLQYLPLYAIVACRKAVVLWSANYGQCQRSILDLFLLGFGGASHERVKLLRGRIELWPLSSSQSVTIAIRQFTVRHALQGGNRDTLEEACVSMVQLWNGPASFNRSMRSLLLRLEQHYLDRVGQTQFNFADALERLSHVLGFDNHFVAPTEIDQQYLEIRSDILGQGAIGDTTIRLGELHTSQNANVLVDNDEAASTKVAVKILRVDATLMVKSHLMTEAAIMAQFDHGNVLKLHGVMTVNRNSVLVLEYCAKGTLRDALRAIPPGEGDFFRYPMRCDETSPTPDFVVTLLWGRRYARYCWGVAHGMEYLAGRNVVHRGLMSQSVFVDDEDNPKIAGFGLTESLTPELASDTAGKLYRESELHLRLPVRWSSPEVLERSRFSSASDVWSFGILCIETFTCGARPYGGWPDSKVVAQVASGYTPIIPPACPEDFFAEVVEPCFAQEPDDRPTFADLSLRTQKSTSRAASVGFESKFRRRLSSDDSSNNFGPQSDTRVRVSEVERRYLASQTSKSPKPSRRSSPWAKVPKGRFSEPAVVARELSQVSEADSDGSQARMNDSASSWSPSTALGSILGEFITGIPRQEEISQTYEDESDDDVDAFLLENPTH